MQDLSSIYPECSNLRMKAERLERMGKIIRMKKGLYVVSHEISHRDLNPFLIANHIYGPSYLSMQTALRYYGLIPEAVYHLQSMTIGVARKYENLIGTFRYVHVPEGYFNIGVSMKEENGNTFMMATPEKALSDLMVYTPKLNIRFQTEMRKYLEEDLRLELEELAHFDVGIIEECARVSKKKTMLRQLIKLIENERNI